MDITPLFPPSCGGGSGGGGGGSSSGGSGGGGNVSCELKPYSYEGTTAKAYINAVNVNSSDYQLVIDGVQEFGAGDKAVCSFMLIVDNQSDSDSGYIKVDFVQGDQTETLDEIEIPKSAKGIPMSFDMIGKLKIYAKGNLRITMLGYYIENGQKTAEPIE